MLVRAGFLIVLIWSAAVAAQTGPDPWFAPDKALHFTLSAGLASAGYGGAALFTEHRGVRLAVGGGLALTAGAAKELADLAGLGSPSWKDFAWDAAGTGVGLFLSWLVDRFVLTPLSGQPDSRTAGGAPCPRRAEAATGVATLGPFDLRVIPSSSRSQGAGW